MRIRVVSGVIEAWNPHGIFLVGRPKDEFAAEINDIVPAIDDLTRERDAVRLLSRVFIPSFADEQAFRPQRCELPGRTLYAALAAKALLRKPG